MKNILIMTNNMNGGGAERVLLTLLRHIPYDRYRVELCLVYREGILLDQLPSGLTVNALFDKRTPQTAECIRTDKGELYQLAARREYDIEIAFLEGNAVKIMSQSSNSKARKIAWVHIDLSQEHYTAPIFGSDSKEYEAFLRFDNIFCVSKAVQDGLEKKFGIGLRAKTSIVLNPIDHEEVCRFAEERFIPKQEITFCAVGRLESQKAFDRLLVATQRLCAEGFSFHVWLLGEGSLYTKLLQLRKDLKLTAVVDFLGFQQNPYPYIKQADAFISCSRVEGLSMVIGEALILRTPVIATSCSGQIEALQHGKYGLLVENSANGVYNGMKAFLTQKYTGHELIHSGSERYLPYQMETYMIRICNLLEQS